MPGFLFQIETSDGGATTVTLGGAAHGVQDPCIETVAISAEMSPPEMQVGPVDYQVYVRGSEYAHENTAVLAGVSDFTMTNVLPDGDTLSDEGELRATVDVRDVYPLFYQLVGASPDTVCGTLAAAGEAMCQPCEDGAAYCVTLVAWGVGAAPLDGEFESVAESCAPIGVD